MRFLLLIISLLTNVLISCQPNNKNYNLLNINQIITYDSLIFPVPKTVILNVNTHVRNFVSNDSLCIVNLTSGKNIPHLYIYHLKQKKLWDHVSLSNILSINDFKIYGKLLFILANNYIDKLSTLYLYDLTNCSFIDSCILFKNKHSGHIYVNSLSISNDSNKILFTLKTFKNPPVQFPLVGFYDIVSKEVRYTKTWYPFIKDSNNELFFMNSSFVLNNEFYISYASTPYLTKLENEKLKIIKTSSIVLDLLFTKDLENIISHNFNYTPEVQVVRIKNRDFILRELIPDEKIFGYNISIITMYDENLNCVGEQVEEYFKDREAYLLKTFTKKYNDSLNISCYVYHNVLKIKFINFSTQFRPLSQYIDYLNTLQQLKQPKGNEICFNLFDSTKQAKTSDNICNLLKYLNQKDSLLLKENLIVLSLNACPTCIKEFLEWYYRKYSLLAQKNTLLIIYKNLNDLEKIKEISNRFYDYFKNTYQLEKIHLMPFLDLNVPFLYIEKINDCKKAKIQKFESGELDIFKNSIFKNSVVVIE